MNPTEVAKHLPLIKFEIIEDMEDKGHLILYTSNTIESAQKKEFKPKFIASFDSLEQAFQGALYIYLSGKFDIKGEKKNLQCKIRHQITLREFVHGRDSGCEWSDPENDIDKRGGISISIFIGEDRQQIYETGYATYAPLYGISKAYTTYIEMLESYLPTKKEIEEIVAFEWRDHVFNKPYVMQDQLCVAGDSVDGTYKNRDGGYGVKVDYFEDYVTFHKKDEIYIVGTYAYLDGQKIFEIENPDTNPIIRGYCDERDPVIQAIKEKYPTANRLNGETYSLTLNGH